MRLVYFVTPCWKRPEVTEVVLAQRLELGNIGVELRTVVVADDDNLGVAHEYGCEYVEHPNDFLGRKVNAGIKHALEAGADFVAVVDSDSLVHPSLLRAHTWQRESIHTSNFYADVGIDGRRLNWYDVRHPFGLGPMFLPRALLEPLDGEVADDRLRRGLSTSMWQRLVDANPKLLRWVFRNVHRLQYVGLKSKISITRQENVARLWPVRTTHPTTTAEPLKALGELYSPATIERIRNLYATSAVVRSRPPIPGGPTLEGEGETVELRYVGTDGPRIYRGQTARGPVAMRVGQVEAFPRYRAEQLMRHFPAWFVQVPQVDTAEPVAAPTG